ncbi:MAG: hypothetical protein PHW03_00810 [Eubacteriales bacterium]|nr:hypothetical protein [Eubacteriales bacterium]MDD4389322.1 hypothetical protein [Eubacteriales bacterium]
MKTFIVFLGILMMCMSGFVYHADANWYTHDIVMMKIIADEAACQAALCIDEEAYGRGEYCFSYGESEGYASEYILSAQRMLKAELIEDIKYEITFEDDGKGYSSDNKERNPAVIIRLTAETEDMFHLPVLSKNEMNAYSRYEIEPIEQ